MKISLRQIQVKVPSSEKQLFRLPKFDVPFGDKVLIEGESGKGKTTLLHLIAGLFYPTAGYVEIGETRIDRLTDEERCRFRRSHIALIFQKLNLIEHLTAFENVCLSLPNRGAFPSGAGQALELVGLADKVNQRSSKLSLGEQQRVAVARVLASDAKIILADEPTSSLDEGNAAKVMELLFSAAREKTLIVVSHDHRISRFFSNLVKFEEMILP